MSDAEEIARSRYVRLTTYKKDGTPVATPVWQAPDGGELFVVSEADAGKVKRIRNNGAVLVTVCDLRGRVRPGAPSVPGTARLQDAAGTERTRALVARRYLLSRLGNGLARLLHLRRNPMIGIAITL